jgi:integrase
MTTFPKPTSRQKSTNQAYQNRCDQLVLRYAKSRGIDIADIEPMAFVNWVISLKENIKAASFRQYRASVVYGLPKTGINQDGMVGARLKLNDEPQTDCIKRSVKTSSSKAKGYPPEILDRVVNELNDKFIKAKYRKPLMAFLVSSIALGLRPSEWGSTKLGHDQASGAKCVIIKNAKTTNGRGTGEERVVVYDHMPIRIQEFIEWMVDYASSREDWDQDQKKIANLHYRIQKHISPKGRRRYSLYSCRHQCSANMKQNYNLETIAEIMGHNSERTATEHYGRRTAGRKIISKHVETAIEDMLPTPAEKEKQQPKYSPSPKL